MLIATFDALVTVLPLTVGRPTGEETSTVTSQMIDRAIADGNRSASKRKARGAVRNLCAID